MLRFPIRVASFLLIALVQSSCAAPPDAITLRGPSMSAALASGRRSASMGRVPAPSAKRRNTKGLTYVYPSDYYTDDVYVCIEPLCNTCWFVGAGGGSQGMGSTAQDLYVAVTNFSEILVLKPSGSSCSVVGTLSDLYGYPFGVAVSRKGEVAGTNYCSVPSCGPGNIAFYNPGATSPSYYATGLLSEFYFGDFDKAGNFYNDGFNGSGEAEIGVVPAGSTSDTSTGITGISFPGGIQVARNGTINIDDQACPCIQIYKPTTRGFAHVGTVPLQGVTDPVTFALDKKNRYLWVTDAGAGMVDQFRYPRGGKIVQSFPGFEEPIGVALIPPDTP